MNDLTIHRSRHPTGWVIGRQSHPPYWEFWNEYSQNWNGSGTVYASKTKLLIVLSNRISDFLKEEEKQREIVRSKVEMDRANNS